MSTHSYQALTSQTTHSAPNSSMNTQVTYYLDKSLQSKHASLVDRGAMAALQAQM